MPKAGLIRWRREAAVGSGPALFRFVEVPDGLAMRPSRVRFPRSKRVVRIRMKSFGRRHRPFFRICAMDSRTGRDGAAIEELGHYDPMVRNKDARAVLNVSRIRYWLSVGAQPSDKVAAREPKAIAIVRTRLTISDRREPTCGGITERRLPSGGRGRPWTQGYPWEGRTCGRSLTE